LSGLALALPRHEPALQKPHAERKREGAERDDADADEHEVGGEELRGGHHEVADAALRDAGWSTTDAVRLSQIVAFLTFQIRVAAGLRALAAPRS
jgi:hypothetical protein